MKQEKKRRGVYEKIKGSGEWWVRYADASGKVRREKAGTKSGAITLYQKRKTEILQGKKLPENLRAKAVTFSVLAKDALIYSQNSKTSYKQDEYRMKPLVEEFGTRPADTITSSELAAWLADKANERDWKPATTNRFKALLSLVYRLGVENKKVSINPAAKELKRRKENNERIRFLNQHEPARTFVDFLKPCRDEESRLRAVIATEYSEHMLEFEIALHTGMRPSEQYGLNWDHVDLARRLVTVLKGKNGETRHIPLNSIALAAFKTLRRRSAVGGPSGPVFVSIRRRGTSLKGYKHWFDPAVEKAGLRDFTWYCLRHTFASRLVMDGVDLPTVSYFMGHKTIQMTMRYAHLAPAHKMAAIERLVSFGKAPKSTTEQKLTDTKTDTSTFQQAVSC